MTQIEKMKFFLRIGAENGMTIDDVKSLPPHFSIFLDKFSKEVCKDLLEEAILIGGMALFFVDKEEHRKLTIAAANEFAEVGFERVTKLNELSEIVRKLA